MGAQMKIFSIALAAAFQVSISCSAASAAEAFPIPLVESGSPASYEGAKADIVGIEVGQSYSSLMDILPTLGLKDVRQMETRIGTRDVSSERFVTYVQAGSRRELVSIHLTSPSVGNQVYAVSRELDFASDQRPIRDDLVAGLLAKYGKHSGEFDVNHGTSRSQLFAWYLGGTGSCDMKHLDRGMAQISELCSRPFHHTGPSVNNHVYSPAKADHYLATASAGADVVIVAQITLHRDDGRADRLVVSVLDLKRRALSAQADVPLIMEAQSKFEATAVTLPKL